ncbi:MAG: glycosyltransferase family 4 protein [Deltaproteobacteria bacterium]|nr:glycosyltransferase family 4 protein [Deltaproteobacteria bacterium]
MSGGPALVAPREFHDAREEATVGHAHPMNILFVVPWDQKNGGVASVVGNLAVHFREHGHKVLFFHPANNERLRAKVTKWGFPGYEGRLRPSCDERAWWRSRLGFFFYAPATFLKLVRLLVQCKIDVVNIHYPSDQFFYFAWLRKLLRYKLVISVHGADLFPDGNPRASYPTALRMLVRSADLLITPSHNTLSATLTLFPELQRVGLCIHNAVSTRQFYPLPAGVKSEDFILCVANHNAKKAVDVLLNAFARLLSSSSSLNLLLVGEGPLTTDLKRLAQELHLNSHVQFLGSKNYEEVAELMRRSRLFVLPSRAEPFGIVLLEALASRKPIVATKVGGIPEFIENGVNGLLVEPDNPCVLSEAMKTVLQDPILANTLATNGYELVKAHFDWKVAAEKYERAFQALVAK